MATINFGGSSAKSRLIKYSSIGLVLAAALLCLKLFVLTQQPYLVPVHTIAEGESLSGQKWHQTNLNLGALGGKYLGGTKTPSGYAVVSLPAGELVSKAQVTSVTPGDFVRLVVTSKTEIGSSIRAGSIVAIWSTARLSGNQFDVPKRLAGAVSVIRRVKQQGVFASKSQEVEVLINPIQAPAVISAMASDSPIFLLAEQ